MEQYIFAPWDDPIARTFAIIIFGIFALSALISLFSGKGQAQINLYAPTALTTIGVVGTFLGIYVGLLDFDVSNIDGSIPSLLDGLKIAFSTSIMGMVSSIVLKAIQTSARKSEIKEDVSAQDIYSAMVDVRDEIVTSRTQSTDKIESLRKSISGEGDSSLVTQLQKFRSDVHDDSSTLRQINREGFADLRKELQDFAEKVAENNSKALIEALQEVIRDFNTKISEQFGENFKQLNEAVGALLVWQEQYKDHVENLVRNFDDVNQGITITRESLAAIEEKSQSIPVTMESLEGAVKLANAQTQDLKAHLEAVAELKERAVTAFPIIEENIKTLTESFGQAVDNNTSRLSEILEEQSASLKEFAEKSFSSIEDATASQQNAISQLTSTFSVAVTDSSSKVTEVLEEQALHLKDVAERNVSSIEAATTSQLSAVGELEKNIGGLTTNLEALLTEVHQNLNGALGDYKAQMESATQEQSNAIQEITLGLRDSLNNSLSDTNEVLRNSFQTFDDQMQNEIQRTIESMGSHLSSLSNKFVEDYTPLTDQLRRVVEMSKRVGA